MATRIKGRRQLKAKLERLKDDVPAAAREAAEEEAGDLSENIRADAPVLTGHLRDSVEYDGPRVIIGADYAAYVEDGTEHMDAQPFIEPNLRRSRESYPERVARAINRELT